MATPGELVKCVAKVFGIPAKTVTNVDRELAVAGLRRSGGRGPSAVQVNANDAAALLIAMATPGTIKSAPQRLNAYLKLPCCVTGLDEENDPLPLPTYSNLPKNHTFGEGITSILNDYAANPEPFTAPGWYGSVRLTAPWKSAIIEFKGEFNQRSTRVYMVTDQDEVGSAELGVFGEGEAGDLTIDVRFTCETFSAIGQLISGKAENN